MIEMSDKYQSYIDTFKKKFPNRTIGNVLDYDDNYILIEAVEDLEKPVGYDTCHAVAYEVRNGSVRLLDGQTNKIYDDPYKLLKKTDGTFEYARLDNLEIRPKGIQRCAG